MQAKKQMTPLEQRMYAVCDLLGADQALLTVIGSYKDTLSDEEVIEMIDLWIRNAYIKDK